MTYGEAVNADEMSAKRYLPEGLVEGCRLRRAVPKDCVITYDDVELPPGRLADRLRLEQYRHFPQRELARGAPSLGPRAGPLTNRREPRGKARGGRTATRRDCGGGGPSSSIKYREWTRPGQWRSRRSTPTSIAHGAPMIKVLSRNEEGGQAAEPGGVRRLLDRHDFSGMGLPGRPTSRTELHAAYREWCLAMKIWHVGDFWSPRRVDGVANQAG